MANEIQTVLSGASAFLAGFFLSIIAGLDQDESPCKGWECSVINISLILSTMIWLSQFIITTLFLILDQQTSFSKKTTYAIFGTGCVISLTAINLLIWINNQDQDDGIILGVLTSLVTLITLILCIVACCKK